MDTIIYKMRQSIYAILILSTLLLQLYAQTPDFYEASDPEASPKIPKRNPKQETPKWIPKMSCMDPKHVLNGSHMAMSMTMATLIL